MPQVRHARLCPIPPLGPWKIHQRADSCISQGFTAFPLRAPCCPLIAAGYPFSAPVRSVLPFTPPNAPTEQAPAHTPMMSNELAGIFVCFIFGLLFTFVSWRAWTRQEAPGHHGRRHRRKDSPFAFWFYLSLHISMAILSLIFAIVFSIHLLRSSWRTVNSGGEGSSRSLTLSQTRNEPCERLCCR